MNENDPMESLRDAARTLRHEPDDAMVARIRAGVEARLNEPLSIADVLASWLRPAAAFVTVVVILFAVAWTAGPNLLAADPTDAAATLLLDEVIRGFY
ncbi:MAG TPA: hypothetical protein VFV54_06415 [Thermoanaerobaculia bacterium]|nr:hypothetical protein [Thermoanaerobaculia bacterium]